MAFLAPFKPTIPFNSEARKNVYWNLLSRMREDGLV